jgi:Ca2+-transporting ATPase
MGTNVFARVAPEHKLRLVQALQELRHVVAMTGDGVNDAPALKRADIGIAMGITGTSVSKEAAKVVLMDDNFASIAAAVEEGRRVYDNLIKSLAFVLPTNLALACILSVAMFFFPTVTVEGVSILLMAMSPTQILWINLVASVTLSIPLAFETLEPNAMLRSPRPADEPVFSRFLLYRLLMVAALMTAGGCGLFLWEYFRILGTNPISAAQHEFALAEAQTICVTVVTFSQIFYLLNCRSLRNSIFSQGIFSNPSIFAGIGVLLLLHACFMYLPVLQNLFGSAALDLRAWLVAILAGAIVLPVISVEKWIRKR